MNKNLKTKLSGTALAFVAAGLVGCANVGASTSSTTGEASVAGAATTDLVHCYGVNACGGHNDCKTANNACAGKASCKGEGFVAMPSKSCADVGGTTEDKWRGTTKVADLSHCYGVNKCNGHNDCKTADNACAGKASCKGTGFVAASAKSCADIGGKTGA